MPRPTADGAQPATAVVVVDAAAVPMEAHFYPAKGITKDLFAGRAGDHRGLAGHYQGLGMLKLRAEDHLAGDGFKGVAIALKVRTRPIQGAARLFLQHLRLIAFVVNVGQQPQVLGAVTPMAFKRQHMP